MTNLEDRGGGYDAATLAAAATVMEEPTACSAKTPLFELGEATTAVRCVLLPLAWKTSLRAGRWCRSAPFAMENELEGRRSAIAVGENLETGINPETPLGTDTVPVDCTFG